MYSPFTVKVSQATVAVQKKKWTSMCRDCIVPLKARSSRPSGGMC